MPVLPRLRALRLALVWLCLAWTAPGCGDAHWATTRWPSDRPGTPRQPVFEHAELGLAIRVTAIDYQPDGLVVHAELENVGAAPIRIERAGIMLAWDALEYAAEPDPPEWLELEPGAQAQLRLGYHLGRPLTGPGARLLVRSLVRDEVAVVDLPAVELPAMPAS